MSQLDFLQTLEDIVRQRLETQPEGSYTARLASGGLRAVAQKIGEEGVELALAGLDEPDARVTAEAADLIFHVVVLLQLRGLSIADVVRELKERHKPS